MLVKGGYLRQLSQFVMSGSRNLIVMEEFES